MRHSHTDAAAVPASMVHARAPLSPDVLWCTRCIPTLPSSASVAVLPRQPTLLMQLGSMHPPPSDPSCTNEFANARVWRPVTGDATENRSITHSQRFRHAAVKGLHNALDEGQRLLQDGPQVDELPA